MQQTKIIIKESSNPHYWYANHIGETFTVISWCPEDSMFLVREREGYLNIVHKKDCEVVYERD